MENYQLNNKFLKKISNLDRVKKQLIMAVFDSITVIIVLLASFSLSINYWYWPKNEIFWVIFLSPFIAIPVFFSFRLYRSFVRYIGFKALSSIIQAVTLYSVIWGLISLMSNHPLIMSLLGISADPFNGGSYYVGISRSVILINWMLALIIIGGSRLLVRSLFENSNFNFNKNKNKVIIYGAGSSGRELSQALQSSIEYKHVAYIDDDSTKDGAYMGNVPIFSYKKIEQIINKYNPSEILLALPSISVKKRKKIIEKLSLLNLNVRSMPSVTQLAEGKVKIDDLLEIDVKDLLGRKPIEADYKLLKIKIENKVVMVTGAGGSIGSEICRQIINLKPNQLILFDISEASLYQIEQEIININANIEIIPILGSVCSPNKLQDIFDNYRVATIYHAAAYKHVPLVESNKMEGILNNVIGTMTLAKSAISSNVETFVLISTDKAVRPTNTMGATKRASELILQALAEIPSNTCFTMVRFGNVLDSSGSVIPLFKKQIRKGGPITVTDANIVRYFMTIPEAVELVIQAGAMSEGGDVFVLDMGEPVRIYDLAVKMIRLSGLKVLDEKNPDGDIEIKYTGLRPGEKLYEELLVGDNTFETDNKLIMKAKEIMINWSDLEPMLIQLREAALSSNRNKSQVLLQNIVPEFSPKSN
jgi:FlaA1/EpsC-like NDP-sugar epimerase